LARVETAGSSSRNRVNDPAFGSLPTAAQSGALPGASGRVAARGPGEL